MRAYHINMFNRFNISICSASFVPHLLFVLFVCSSKLRHNFYFSPKIYFLSKPLQSPSLNIFILKTKHGLLFYSLIFPSVSLQNRWTFIMFFLFCMDFFMTFLFWVRGGGFPKKSVKPDFLKKYVLLYLFMLLSILM